MYKCFLEDYCAALTKANNSQKLNLAVFLIFEKELYKLILFQQASDVFLNSFMMFYINVKLCDCYNTKLRVKVEL